MTKTLKFFPDGRLSSNDAAAYLGLTPKTLAVWRCQGTGPVFMKLGRYCFYRKVDLDQWMESRRVTSTAEARAKRRMAAGGAA